MNRRQFLGATAAVTTAGALAACAAFKMPTGPVTPAQIANYLALVGNGVTALVPSLSGAGLTATVTSEVVNIAGDIQAAAAAFIQADATGSGGAIVTRVGNDFKAVMAAIASVIAALPDGAKRVISAIETVLPYVESLVGVAITAFGAAPHAVHLSLGDAVGVLEGARR